MEPVLIGYFPKMKRPRPDDFDVEAVDEICSVSSCIAHSPEGWAELWRHNEMWCFDTPGLAREIAGDDSFVTYAYKLLPIEYRAESSLPVEIHAPEVTPLPAEYESLGYDVVSRDVAPTFECSPLSCNLMAREIPVNRYCLIEHLEQAVETARRFAAAPPEPGSYFVVQVFRARGV